MKFNTIYVDLKEPRLLKLKFYMKLIQSELSKN